MAKLKMDDRPNILLLMCDQMRGDAMGSAGHPDVKTPWLDTIADAGLRFSRSYSTCPSCIAARASLLTGRGQAEHGRVGYEDGVDWDYPHMLPDELSKGGYHTECVGKMHVHPPWYRCGFDNLQLHDGNLHHYRLPSTPLGETQLYLDAYLGQLKGRNGLAAEIDDTGIECNSWVARPWIYDEMDHPTNWVASRSVDFLQKRDRSKPFFLFSSFVRPHPPFDAPACYFDMYKDAQLRAPASSTWLGDLMDTSGPRTVESMLTIQDEELRRQALIGYYACITHMDHQIGRIHNELVKQRILEDTLIIFVSDHGEMLFDHGLYRKALGYEGSAHVPLLMRVGKNLAFYEGARGQSTALCELRDIMPTLLEAADLPLPQDMQGRSLLPFAKREAAADARAFLHGEHSYAAMSNHWIATAHDKYIWYSQTGKEQYFDLRNDPRETQDRHADPACKARVDELRGHLVASLSGREEGYVKDGQLVAGRPPKNVLDFARG